MFESVNRLSSTVFDGLIWFCRDLPSILQISVLAFFVTIIALLVFRFTSNQPEIAVAKDKITAHLLELRLFRDNLRVTLGAQARVVIYTFKYLKHTLVPAILMLLPFSFLIVQIESTYAWRSLTPGESTILTVELDEDHAIEKQNPRLSVSSGLLPETPALRLRQTNQVLWRVRALAPGIHTVTVSVGDERFERRIVVGIQGGKLAPAVYSRDDIRTLTAPGTIPLTHGAVSSMEVVYPRNSTNFAGLSRASWLFFILSLAIAYALRGLFSVTF